MDSSIIITPFVFEKLTENELKFIFSQAEKKVKTTSDEGTLMYNKSVTIVTICVPVLGALIALLFSGKQLNLHIAVSASNTMVFLIWIMAVLKFNLKPTRYNDIGSEPKPLFDEKIYRREGKSPEWWLLVNEIDNFQRRINLNVANNRQRGENIKTALSIIYILPFFLLLINFCWWLARIV